MEWLLGSMVAALLGAGAAAFLRRSLLGRPLAVDALGLRQVGVRRWSGTVNGHELVLSISASGRLRFELWGAPAGLSMEPRGEGFPALAVATGDADLDAVAIVSGEPGEVLAHLTPAARVALVDAARAGMTVERGAVRGVFAGADALDGIGVAAALLARLPALVTDPRDVLADRVRADPDPGVRLRALEVLRGAGAWAGRAALDAAADPDARLRLLSAEIRDDAAALGKLVVAPDVPGEVRDRAFTRLRERAPDALREALLEALATPGMASAALHRIGVLQDPALAEAVLGHARRSLAEGRLHSDGDALVRVLARLPAERTHDVLLALVAGAPKAVAQAAVRLLSRNADTATLVGLGEIASVRKELLGTVTEAAGVAAVDALGARIAGALQLIYVPEHHAVRGVIDHLLVEVRVGGRVAVTVSDLPDSPPVIAREPTLSPLADDAFHRQWRVSDEPADLAWFPPEVRDALVVAGAGAKSLAMMHGKLRVIDATAGEEAVTRRVGVVLAAAKLVLRTGELEPIERLVHAWRTETAPPLRRRLVRAALAHDPEAAEVALGDSDPSVVRTAARLLRRWDRLVDLASSSAVPAGERRGALHDLDAIGDRGALSRALAGAIDDPEIGPLAVALAGRAGLPEHAPAIARYIEQRALLAADGFDDLRVRSALRVLAAFADPTTERALVGGLACADPAVRRELVEALGQVGGAVALVALKRIAAERGAAEAAAARVAIEAIRERGGRGALALASLDAVGRVAIAAQGGEVAVSEAEDG